MQLLHTLAFATYCFIFSAALTSNQGSAVADTPPNLLAKVITALSSLTALQYEYVRELNYPSEAYYHESRISTYLEFTEANDPLNFKFQTDEPESVQVYNGSELFALRKKTKSIALTRKASLSSLEHLSFLYNSPLTLRNSLPAIFADSAIPKTLADTLVDNNRFHIIRFSLKGKALHNIEGYRELASTTTITYQLLIDAATYLPAEVLQTNSENKGDYIKTNFVALDSKPKAPAEASWYYSTYLNEYSLEQTKQSPAPMAPGTMSPTWQLPIFGSADSAGIGQNDNKVTLLEFWFKNCGFCIAAVPSLNTLSKKYAGKNFQVLAVNVFDSEHNIEQFLGKTIPVYPTVYNGNAVALRYGLNSYPSAVLLDKDKRVLYAGDLDMEKLEALIKATLKVSKN